MSTPDRKPLAEYPEWRTKQCVHCKAGEPMGAMAGYHWTGDPDPPACTAQSAEEYIADLERKLAEAERKLADLAVLERQLMEAGRKARAWDSIEKHKHDVSWKEKSWVCWLAIPELINLPVDPKGKPKPTFNTALEAVEASMKRKA